MGNTLTPEERLTPPDRGSVCIVPAIIGTFDMVIVILYGLYGGWMCSRMKSLPCVEWGCVPSFPKLGHFMTRQISSRISDGV